MSAPGSDRLRLLWALVVYGGVVAVVYREQVLGPLLGTVTAQLALTSAALLQSLGISVTTEGNLLLTSSTMYEISYRCTGVLPISGLMVCILASRAPGRIKAAGIVVGALLLIILNQLRIVHVIMIGSSDPDMFRLAHDVYWNSAMVLSVLMIFAFWKKWARYKGGREQVAGVEAPNGQHWWDRRGGYGLMRGIEFPWMRTHIKGLFNR